MSIIATNNSVPRELIPSGNYVARCYKMIQIGTVEEIINGEKKQLHKVRIGWEFPNDQKVFSEEKGPQPIVYDEEYTLSMGDKANLRKMLESWRGKGFSVEEAKAFDITKLIGVTCMVNIIHVQGKRDPSKTYSKIGSVSSVPKGFTIPAQINPTFVLSYDNFDHAKFDSLPDFIKDKMKTSVEYKALTGYPQQSQQPVQQPVQQQPVQQPQQFQQNGHQVTQPAPRFEVMDDLPF